MEITKRKDAHITKLKEKLDATKAYLATVNQENQQNEFKTIPLASGKDNVVQTERKKENVRKQY